MSSSATNNDPDYQQGEEDDGDSAEEVQLAEESDEQLAATLPKRGRIGSVRGRGRPRGRGRKRAIQGSDQQGQADERSIIVDRDDRNPLWKYMTEKVVEGTDTVRRCKVMVEDKVSGTSKMCNYVVRQQVGGQRSTGSLLYHFQTHHPEIVREEMPAKYAEWVAKGKIRATSKVTSILRYVEKGPLNIRRPHFWSERNIGIVQELATELILDKQPLSAVQRRGKIEAIKIRAPWFRPPSRWWLGTNYLPAVERIVRKRVQSELTLASPHVGITSDSWASRYAGSFQSLTGTAIVDLQDKWGLKQYKLGFQRLPALSHTAILILSQLQELCKSWGIQSQPLADGTCIPIFATTDSGANIKRACEMSDELVHVPCVAHKFHRVMLAAVGATTWLEQILQKLINISRNMAMSDKQKGAYVRYMQVQQGKIALLPVSPCTTRWNSFADAIDRYLLIHQDIRKYAISQEAQVSQATVIQENILTNEEVRKLEAVQPIMKRVREAVQLLEIAEEATGVNIMFILNALYKQVEEMTAQGRVGASCAQFANAVKSEMEKKFTKSSTFWYSFMGFFDPKNQVTGCVASWLSKRDKEETLRQVQQKISSWAQLPVDASQSGETSTAPASHAAHACGFLANLLASQALPGQEGRSELQMELLSYKSVDTVAGDIGNMGFIDPLKFWFRKRQSLPNLARVAQCVLSVSATSVASEQLFSSSGEMSSGRKNRIGKELLELLVFLYCNAIKDDVVAVTSAHVKAIRKELRRKRQINALEQLVQQRVAAAMQASTSQQTTVSSIAEVLPNEEHEGMSVVAIQQMQQLQHQMDMMPEEDFYELEIQMEVEASDPYADIPVTCVDDCLVWEEPCDDISTLLFDLRLQEVEDQGL